MKVKILHLSDLHFATNSVPQDTVLDSLFRKIKQEVSSDNKPNAMIITGDIAFSGQKKEYEKAGEYLDKIINVCDIEIENVFMIPGNHDVNRSKIKIGHIKWWYNFKDEESLTENLSSDDSLPKIIEKTENYFQFAKKYMDGKINLEKHGQFITEISLHESTPIKKLLD
ncbi:MAG: hypothetical protein GY936_03125 [Ignavibacteriae bacterium]|nr:hypothetical protein [Ignavibacteriota bacterium]